MTNNKRLTYLDTAAGIFIIYMIFYHCSQFSGMTHNQVFKFLQVVFSCFMAWFFFKSGMFYKRDITFKEEFIHTLCKLWRPYLLFWFIGIVVEAIKYSSMGDTNLVHYVLTPFKSTLLYGGVNNGVLPMWFLVTLFAVRTLSPVMLKVCNGYGWAVCGVVGAILCHINGIYGWGFIHPYYISNFFPAMFFYGMGFLMKDKQFDKKIFLIALVIYAISFAWPFMVDFHVNSVTRGNTFLWYVYAIAGIIVINYICKNSIVQFKPVTDIGRNSMWWFLAHWPVISLLDIFYVNVCKISGGGIACGRIRNCYIDIGIVVPTCKPLSA